ncbi:MAG: metallophosphoesterase [Candidatus Promineifilaceae bacterium]|nr:metallophosphoesterase [Candidatus Promineifilaceae bacterium]
MKILAVSDRVMDHIYSSTISQRYSDVDLIVGCGDLPFYYLDFLASALDVPLVYVRGNHDAGPQYTFDGRVLTGVRGGIDIHRRCVLLKGVILAGLEGSMRYRPRATVMYTEAEMRQEVLRLLPTLLWNRLRYGRALDILVTHSPVFQIHDRSDLAHTGFKIFRRLLRLFRPTYMLHGHIHVYRPDVPRVSHFAATTIINVYPYRLLHYNDPPPPDER